MYYYHPSYALSDPAKLYNDFRWNVTRPQGFEAMMRVRCSQGLQVQEYPRNFCKCIPIDVDLSAFVSFSHLSSILLMKSLLSLDDLIRFFQIDCDKAIMETLKHDDKLQDDPECSFRVCICASYRNSYSMVCVYSNTIFCVQRVVVHFFILL
ncbi:hypothetical protein Hanom_Chr14g01284841 [Helianthus anomalus]